VRERPVVPTPIFLRISEERKRKHRLLRPFAYHPFEWATGWFSRIFNRLYGGEQSDYFDPQLTEPRSWPVRRDPFEPAVPAWKKRR